MLGIFQSTGGMFSDLVLFQVFLAGALIPHAENILFMGLRGRLFVHLTWHKFLADPLEEGTSGMSLLFKIVYAAHANGTHHKLALDALKHLNVSQKDQWTKLFLKYSERYLEGSKEPDKVFKDFKNHVLHVGDNYWGGAEDKAREWYDDLVAALVAEKWEDAVYSAGVLSHYYTDPIMPFHTAQSEAESTIHRAAEWSINKTYNELKRQASQDHKMMVVLPPEDNLDFAAGMVRQGAELSHKYYSHLIAHYNFDRGVVRPEEGYNEVGNQVLAVLIEYAARGFAVMLDGAIKASGKEPPKVYITAATLLAGLKIPVKWVSRKMTDAEDRRLVEAMYDELHATGKVVDNLPEDDALIRQLHKREVLGIKDHEEILEELARAPAPGSEVDEAFEKTGDNGPDKRFLDRHDEHEGEGGSLPEKRPNIGPTFYLTAKDDVVDAPSIGVKTAKRLYIIDIQTVSDLLEAEPGEVSEALDVSYITPDTIVDWQSQARLQCDIPGLRGHDAQFLVGCGYRTVVQVETANPETLLVDLQAFLITKDGERLLRVGNEPDLDEVKGWIENAKQRHDIQAA